MNRRHFIKTTGAAGIGSSAFSHKSAFANQGSALSNGFYMPEEALEHERCFMQWPVNIKVYPEKAFLRHLQKTIADIANTISEFEPVVMLVGSDFAPSARKLLSSRVELWDIPTDDLWARDSGPVFVVNDAGELAMSSVNFNAWGAKQPHENDKKIAERVAAHMGLRLFNAGLVGEAGGIESNGRSILIAHESSWINKNRNKGSKADITRLLCETFGANDVIWAPGLYDLDITDYHIDALARFVSEKEILIQLPSKPDPKEPYHKAAWQTYEILKDEGFSMIVIEEPYDLRVLSDDFVASYVNYYLPNGAVVMGEFGDAETDEIAEETMREIYPEREIIMLNVDALGEVGGGIHCATQQQPKV